MSIPKEPRQLMINLMYLVLTALLALNVSSEILNAFNTVNSGITDSNGLLDSKNDLMMGMITIAAAKDSRAETQLILKQAEDAKKLSDDFVAYVDAIKAQVKEAAGGANEDYPEKLKTEGEMEKTSNLFLTQGKGKELHNKIEEARSKFLDVLGKESQIDIPLKVVQVPVGEHAKNWEEYNFDRVPAIAVMTILTKFQQDAKSAESTILDYLRRKINAEDIPVDKMAAQVVAPSAYVRKGAEYTADIFIGATSEAIKPKVFIGSFSSAVQKDPADPNGKSFLQIEGKVIPLSGAREIDVVGGMGKIKETASGERKFQGVIQIPHPNLSKEGEFRFYPFEFGYETFEVGKAVVSPTAMNVLYIGVDNPIKISVPGYASDKVTASGCGIVKVKGEEYNAKPTKGGEDAITVTVKTAKGSETSTEKFRVLRIPEPYAYILSSKGGPIKIGEFKAAEGITVKNPDFVFQIPYTVTSFELIYAPKVGNVVSDVSNTSKFSNIMKDIQKKAKPGDIIVLQNVTVRMPDGRSVPINTSFKLIGG